MLARLTRPGPPRVLLALMVLVAAACGTTDGSRSPTASGIPTAGTTPTSSGDPSASSGASPGPALDLGLDPIVEGLDRPLDLAAARDGSGRVFVAEQGGRVRVVRDGILAEAPYLDIAGRISAGGERGLLGIALHPDFPQDPRIFVDYTDLAGDTVVSSFDASLDADAADPESERIILQVAQPYPNHNGGALVFGPDGMLYIALGDGGSGGDPEGNGRRLDTLLAKILRIDIDVPPGQTPAYDIPTDNPWADVAGGARPEIWLTGLRNPWRMRFDSATGDLWLGDVGQGEWEEIDVARQGVGGLDFGWATMEGAHCYAVEPCDQTGLTLPVAEYGHELGCAVVGGVVMHDPLEPGLEGLYLFADECSGRIWTMDPLGDTLRAATLEAETGRQISAIGEAADGRVLLTDLSSGELLAVTR